MKHQNLVLCVQKHHVTHALGGKLEHGIHGLSTQAILESIQPHLEYRKRADLEEDHNYLHFIPYILFPTTEIDQETGLLTTSLATYRRPGKGEGEARLHGKLSIGYGGHVEEEDATKGEKVSGDITESYLLFDETIYKCVRREIGEEVGFRVADVNEAANLELQIVNSKSVIVDHSEDVGRVHLGLLYMGILPRDVTAYPVEDDNEDGGYIALRDLRTDHWDELEGWSRMVVDSLLKNEIEFNNNVLATKK